MAFGKYPSDLQLLAELAGGDIPFDELRAAGILVECPDGEIQLVADLPDGVKLCILF